MGIAYGIDVETARRVIIEAVKVKGELPDKPVDALYNEMGETEMIFRVRWWIESYVDTWRVIDRVHTALQHALDEAGIESPFPTQNVNLLTQQDASRIEQQAGAPPKEFSDQDPQSAMQDMQDLGIQSQPLLAQDQAALGGVPAASAAQGTYLDELKQLVGLRDRGFFSNEESKAKRDNYSVSRKERSIEQEPRPRNLLGIQGVVVGIITLVMAFKGGDWGAALLGALSIIFRAILILNYANPAAILTFIWIVAIFAIVGGIVEIIQAFRQK